MFLVYQPVTLIAFNKCMEQGVECYCVTSFLRKRRILMVLKG